MGEYSNQEYILAATEKVATVCFFLAALVLIVRRRRMSRLRHLWDSRDKDVVTLHMFPRAYTAPCPTPYPLKLETFMKVAGVEYVPDFEEPMSKKGKTPWITLNSVDVADSQLSIEHITRELGIDIESNLTEEEKAVSRAFRIMIEEHFFWCVALELWVFNEAREVPKFFPPVLRQGWVDRQIFKTVTRKIRKQGHASGIGRHSQEEVENLGRQDLRALSAQLGSKDFLLGDKVCLADITLFAFTSLVHILPEDTKSIYKPFLLKEVPNLVEHNTRMMKKYWPDFKDVKYKTDY